MGIGIMSVARLRTRLAADERAVTVIDARHHGEYVRGHVPGAIWIGWEDWVAAAPETGGPMLALPGYWGELSAFSPDQWSARLSARGVSGDRPLVVYADGPRSKGREGRIAWLLLYLGAPDVYLLDGGWRAWIAAGGAVTGDVGDAAPGCFKVEIQELRRARLDDLRARHLAGALPRFVDTRGPREFAGEIHPYLPRMGHLPGAVNLDVSVLFDEQERFVKRAAYQQRLPEAMRDASELVTYCEVGIRASLLALIHELITGQIVRVFDASLMAWGLEHDLPVHRGHAEP